MKVRQPKPALHDVRAYPFMQGTDADAEAWVDQHAQSPQEIRALLKLIIQTQRSIMRHLNGRT